MLDKITRIEVAEIAGNMGVRDFIIANKTYLEAVKGFNSDDF
jgi:hypothetical protein